MFKTPTFYCIITGRLDWVVFIRSSFAIDLVLYPHLDRLIKLHKDNITSVKKEKNERLPPEMTYSYPARNQIKIPGDCVVIKEAH